MGARHSSQNKAVRPFSRHWFARIGPIFISDFQRGIIKLLLYQFKQRRPANRVEKITGTQPHSGLRTLHLALWSGFIFCAAGWFILLLHHPALESGRWVEGLFLI